MRGCPALGRPSGKETLSHVSQKVRKSAIIRSVKGVAGASNAKAQAFVISISDPLRGEELRVKRKCSRSKNRLISWVRELVELFVIKEKGLYKRLY